ncbi:phage portal protein [Mannheimia haemolytica]
MAKKHNNLTASKAENNKSFSMIPINNSLEDGWTVAPALDYVGLNYLDNYGIFEPPINRWALAKLPHQNAQHCGILQSRAKMIVNGYQSGGLSKNEMHALVLNLLMFGDVGLLKVRNGFGKVVRLAPLSSLYLRCKRDGCYRYLVRQSLYDMRTNEVIDYKAEDIIFIKLYDPMQQLYGVPDYIGGIQSALLNTDATRFRRRYFANGSHLGFILYATDPDMDDDMEKAIRESITGSKGVGNFKSMFVNIAGGHPDGLKVIPIGDTGKKDEFGTIKDVSAQDILTAHRYPAGLAGIIPASGSFGDIEKIRNTYRLDEVLPMQEMIADFINRDLEITGGLKISFKSE